MSKIRVPTGHVHVGAGGGGGGGGDPVHEAQQDARILAVETKATSNQTATAQLTTKVNGLGTRTQTVETKVAQQDGRITGLTARDDQQEGLIAGLRVDVDTQAGLIDDLDEGNAQRDQDIAGLKAGRLATNQRVTQTETKNIEQDGRIATAEADLRTVKPAVTSNTAAIDAVRLRVADTEAKNVQQDGRITQAENNRAGDLARISEVERRADVVETISAGLDTRTGQLESRADAFDAAAGVFDDRIEAAEAAIAAVTKDIGDNYVRGDTVGKPMGPAQLDANGKLRSDQIPAELLGALQYQGVWNVQTNVPNLRSSVGTKGQYYVVSVAGTRQIDGNSTWNVGDWIVFNGTRWDRLEGDQADILTVNGKGPTNGNVQLTGTDIPVTDPYSLGKTTVQGQLDTLASGAAAGGTDISNIKVRLGNAEAKLDNHDGRIFSLERTVEGHGVTLNSHGNTLIGHETRLNGLASGKLDKTMVGVANGVAPTGADNKIPIEFLPDAIIGGSKYRGLWDADQNQPPLASGVGEEGAFYKVSVPGQTNLDTYAEWLKDDTAVFKDGKWSRIAGGAPIQDINGQQGIKVTLFAGNIPTATGGAEGITVQAELDTLHARTTVVPTHTAQIAALGRAVTLLDEEKVDVAALGVPGGVATLDGDRQVPLDQLPAAVKGALTYRGVWDADQNEPPLLSSTGIPGYYYVVSVAGETELDGIASWQIEDWAVFNGTKWNILRNGGDTALQLAEVNAQLDDHEDRIAELEGQAPNQAQVDSNSNRITELEDSRYFRQPAFPGVQSSFPNYTLGQMGFALGNRLYFTATSTKDGYAPVNGQLVYTVNDLNNNRLLDVLNAVVAASKGMLQVTQLQANGVTELRLVVTAAFAREQNTWNWTGEIAGNLNPNSFSTRIFATTTGEVYDVAQQIALDQRLAEIDAKLADAGNDFELPHAGSAPANFLSVDHPAAPPFPGFRWSTGRVSIFVGDAESAGTFGFEITLGSPNTPQQDADAINALLAASGRDNVMQAEFRNDAGQYIRLHSTEPYSVTLVSGVSGPIMPGSWKQRAFDYDTTADYILASEGRQLTNALKDLQARISSFGAYAMEAGEPYYVEATYEFTSPAGDTVLDFICNGSPRQAVLYAGSDADAVAVAINTQIGATVARKADWYGRFPPGVCLRFIGAHSLDFRGASADALTVLGLAPDQLVMELTNLRRVFASTDDIADTSRNQYTGEVLTTTIQDVRNRLENLEGNVSSFQPVQPPSFANAEIGSVLTVVDDGNGGKMLAWVAPPPSAPLTSSSNAAV